MDAPSDPTQAAETISVQSPTNQQVFNPLTVHDDYPAGTSRILGITRVVFGALSAILQIALIVIESDDPRFSGLSEAGTGIWAGAFFILSGTFGIRAASTKTHRDIKTHMILSIASASLFATPQFIISAIGIDQTADRASIFILLDMNGALALYSLLMLLGLAQGLCDIWAAALCSPAVCNGCSAVSPEPGENAAQTGGLQNTQVVYVEQPPAYPGQPQPDNQPGPYVSQPPVVYPAQFTAPPPYSQPEEKKNPQGLPN